MIIEPLHKRALDQVTTLALKLWSEHDWTELRQEFAKLLDSQKDIIYLAKMEKVYVGFIHMSLRHDYVEGSETSPVGYIEGIYVEEQHRRKGISRKLVEAGEKWSSEKGCSELASDAELDNQLSQDFHKNIGFREAGKIVAFIKKIK